MRETQHPDDAARRIIAQEPAMRRVRALVGERERRYLIITYGCQMNAHDSEKLAGMLGQMGYQKADSPEAADLILFNTCCVRDHAEAKVHGNVGALRPLKQRDPERVIIICGCMMQQEGVAEALMRKYPFIDLVFGTHNLHRFPEYLLSVLTERRPVRQVLGDAHACVPEGLPALREPGVSAFLTIMYGCDNYCSYCIVPYVRGRERSRAAREIVAEAKRLADSGVREITLLGQNVNSYGKTLEEPLSFADLLRQMDRVEGIERIRFMTSHPKDLSNDLIDAMALCDKVCPQLHLPVQSGSDRILQAMNRRYTSVDYLRLVDKLRARMPDIGLTTDIIVGFPGETEAEFDETLELVRRVRFDSAYMFAYSPRKGTKAAAMGDHLDPAIKKARLHRLIEVQNAITLEVHESYVGKEAEVLVESVSKRSQKRVSGRTATGRMVNFAGSADDIGSLKRVLIQKANPNTLSAKPVQRDIT